MQASVVLRDSVLTTDKIYDYCVPDSLTPHLLVGQYVEVPFGIGNRPCVALVMSISPDNESKFECKNMTRIVDPEPVLQPDQIELLSFIRSRYSSTYGDAIRLMVPAMVSTRQGKSQKVAYIKDRDTASSILSECELDSLPQIRILEMLFEYDEVPVSEIMSVLSISRSPVDSLVKKGLIVIEKRDVQKSSENSPGLYDDFEKTDPYPPSEAQENAISQILAAKGKKEFLLFGITGSGKTEVYLQCAQTILDRGESILFLVPEISLTPQMILWITGRFPGQVAVLHSRLTPKEKYEQWDAIRKGRAHIVVGARSAVFAPIHNLKLILIDEEQDSSYKSETHPRYHARDIARQRARILDAALVMGSATPSVETYFSAQEGFTTLLHLPERVNEAILPSARIIDMREELRSGNRSIFSRGLHSAMLEAFAKDEQVILFLNRRGYSSLLLCRACGQVVVCPKCSVSMTLHTQKRAGASMLICHYCGRTQKVPDVCPSCQSTLQGKFGLGTQQLEEMVRHEFPDQSVIRMDQDTTVGRESHARLLSEFRDKKARVLVGTQMIAKGHDFPDVTVVGIISTDLLLRASDFRAGERAFQLITQASGRAGRGEKAGKVFLQTYQPEDDILLCAAQQDYELFFRNEIEYRRRLGYPPYRALGSILISNPVESIAKEQAEKVMSALKETRETMQDSDRIELFGPTPAQIYRLRDRYRLRINLKTDRKSQLSHMFSLMQARFFSEGILLYMDIDPLW
jgi:primosomal protein N' (replication factor Y)